MPRRQNPYALSWRGPVALSGAALRTQFNGGEGERFGMLVRHWVSVQGVPARAVDGVEDHALWDAHGAVLPGIRALAA